MFSIASRLSKQFLIMFLLSLLATTAEAQFFVGPNAEAMGGAGRAAVDGGEASYLNPAAVAHAGRYFASGAYGFGTNPKSGDFQNFAILLTDGSAENILPGSLSYVRRRTDLPGGLSMTEQDIQFTLAGFALKKVALGVSAHRLYSSLSTGAEHVQDNGHIGLLYTPVQWLGLAFVASNVIPADNSVELSSRLSPSYALGGHFIFVKDFRLRLDLLRPDKFKNERTDIMFGLESFFRDDFVFRLGGFWRETADQMYLTAGLGYHGPKLSFDYSIQRDIRNGEGIRHLFDLWLPI
jgi:hypothetical protein